MSVFSSVDNSNIAHKSVQEIAHNSDKIFD